MAGEHTGFRSKFIARIARVQPWYLLTRHQGRGPRAVFTLIGACISVGVLTSLAVWTEQPLIFPSLAPSAFLFFYQPSGPASCPRNAILAHSVGVLIGWGAFSLFGASTGMGILMGSTLSLGVISFFMIALDFPHPPAASTTLMVSLGLLTSPLEIMGLIAGIVILSIQGIVLNRLSGIAFPIWGPLSNTRGNRPAARALATEAPEDPQGPYGDLAGQILARRNVTREPDDE